MCIYCAYCGSIFNLEGSSHRYGSIGSVLLIRTDCELSFLIGRDYLSIKSGLEAKGYEREI